MKLRLLIGGLMFTAIGMNAQLNTIDENFDNFTAGNNTFPQSGWSAVLAPNPMPFPPAPLMIVTSTANKVVQAYSGNNSTAPSYLITPQIVAPTGNKTLSFAAAKSTGTNGNGTLEVGLASNPADMTTFVSISNPISLTSETVQTYSIPVPASAATYIVFKFTPTIAHTALQIDNVVYNTTASLGVHDNNKATENLRFALNSDQTTLEFISKKDLKNIRIYSSSGQKIAEGRPDGHRFGISTLKTGVYYMNIETSEGKTIQTKFIKR